MKPLHELSSDELAALSDDEFIDQVVEAIDVYSAGRGPNLRLAHLRIARSEENAQEIEALWKEAPPPKPTPKPVVSPKTPETQPGFGVSSGANSLKNFKPRDLRGVKQLAPVVEAKAIEIKSDPIAIAEPITEVPSSRALTVIPRSDIYLPNVGIGELIVKEMNQKHAVIGNYNTKCLVLSWERWPLNPDVIAPTYQSRDDFKARYQHIKVEIRIDKRNSTGTQLVRAGDYWLDDPGHAAYDGVAFEPSAPTVLAGNRMNLFRGFSVEPARGSWKLMERHTHEILANGDNGAGAYILKWWAWMYQNLGKPPGSALLWLGDEGVGKQIISQAHSKVLGPYAWTIADRDQVFGTFTGHLQHCIYIFLDEVAGFRDKKSEGLLKNWLTEEKVTVRPMYAPPFMVRNCLHMNMATNYEWALPVGEGARRYSVFKVPNTRKDDEDYFVQLGEEIRGGGAEAMLFDMLRMNLAGFSPRKIYRTLALTQQKQLSLFGKDKVIESWLQEGRLPGIWNKFPNRATTDAMWEDVKKIDRNCGKTELVNRLHEIFGQRQTEDPPDKVGMWERSTGALRGHQWPELWQCRAAWERRFGGKWNWYNNRKDWGEA